MRLGQLDGWDDTLHALEVAAGDFIVATAAAADVQEYAPVTALLQRVRRALGIDAAFVSDCHAEPATDALQRAYGMQLLAAGSPAGRFRFEAVPVVTGEGGWRGTLCCRVPASGNEEGAAASVARLVAECFEAAAA